MKRTVPLQRVPALGALTSRQLNRVVAGVGAALVLLVAGFTAFYVLDQSPAAGPTLAERRIPQLEEAVRKDPNSIDLRLQLAGAYGTAKRYEDAIGQLNAILAASPDEKTALVTRGDLLLTQGKLDAAADDYRHVIAIAKDGEFANVDVQLHQAFYSLGLILVKQGKPADAIPQLQSALIVQQTDADTLNLLGRAFLDAGDPKKAIDPLRTAVLFVPVDWAEPYQSLAAAYRGTNQPDEAAWADAMVAFAGGDATVARAALNRLTSGPAATDAYIGLGLVEERLGDKPAAITAYQAALVRDPGNFTAASGASRLTGSPMPTVPASSAPPTSPAPSVGAFAPPEGVLHA